MCFFKIGRSTMLLAGILCCLVSLFTVHGYTQTSIFVSDRGGVKEFDEATGGFLGIFGDTADMSFRGLAFHPVSGNLLAVSSVDGVFEFDGTTGALIGPFGETAANLVNPDQLRFHPFTGNLFVLNGGGLSTSNPQPVREFDGTTGSFLRSLD